MVLYHNSDNTSCYIISILYILQNTPYLIDFIKNYKSEDNLTIIELQKLFFSTEEQKNLNDFKKLIGTKNEIWNETAVWKEATDQAIKTFITPTENKNGSEASFVDFTERSSVTSMNDLGFSMQFRCSEKPSL